MNEADVRRWYAEYLEAFAQCGRGERPTSDLIEYYGVPMTLTTNDSAATYTTVEEAVGWASDQAAGMQAAGYLRTDEWRLAKVTVLNDTTALYDVGLARIGADGSEISRFAFTYLIVDGTAGRRIAALVVAPA